MTMPDTEPKLISPADAGASVDTSPAGGEEVPDWLRDLSSRDVAPEAEESATGIGDLIVEIPDLDKSGESESPAAAEKPAEAEDSAREKRRVGLRERAGMIKDGINALGARGNAFGERIARATVQQVAAADKGNLGEWARRQQAEVAAAEAPAETPEAEAAADEADKKWVVNVVAEMDKQVEEKRIKEQTAREARLAKEKRLREEQEAEVARQVAEQGIKDEVVEAYKAQVAAEAEVASLAEEQRLAEELRAETERVAAEQAQRDAEEAARLEEVKQQAEARRQRYEALKTKELSDNQVELLVRGVAGRDADGQRSAAGMIEDAAQVITNELAAAQQKELAVREGINQAQELMRQRETELQQQKAVKLEELKTNAEERLQLPGMRAELGRVAASLEEVNAELNRLSEMPSRLQKTYAAEIARLKAEKAGFTAKKNGLSRTVTQLEVKAAKFVEAQTPEVETWHQIQLLQAGREVQTLVDQQEGYDRADVEAWVRMELDTTIHEAGVALDNLERWQRLAADPEGIAKQIAEVQAQQDMAAAGVETRIAELDGDITRFTENLAEAKEIQKRAKSDKVKERANREVKRAEVALADAQEELAKANKELKISKKARKAAVGAKRSELLPAELLEEEGVNYGGEMAVTSYEGEITMVSLVDIVKGNRGRRKEAPRTEAATQVGKLAEFVIWGGEAMEPDENGNPVPIKVKGLYEREAMGFVGRLEAEVELARQRLEQQAGGEAKETEDVNVEIGRALDQAGEGVRRAVELVIETSGENQLGNISVENKKRLGEMIGSINTEMVNQAASLGSEAMAGETPEVQQKIGNWVGAMEMILDNAPAEAGNLAGLRQLVETLKKFA